MLNTAWTSRSLGELFEIGAGKTMSATARSGAEKTPFLRTSNVLWDEIDLSSVDEMFIPEPERSAKLLRPGDLLVCEGGTIGRAAIWNGETEAMSFQNHLHRLRPTTGDVEPRFYVYFLQSAFTQLGLFEGAANRTTIPNLSRNRLAGLEVPIPPIDEQRAVVATLARVRDAVSLHDRVAAGVSELKRAAMRKLFACGLRGEPQKETEIGPVPGSWRIRQIGSLCVKARSVDLHRDGDQTIQYVDVSSVSLRIEKSTRWRLNEAPSRARKRIQTGDVIFATVRPTLLRVATVPREFDAQVCSTAFCVLRQDADQVADRFIYYVVQREEFVEQLSNEESGASYPAVTDRIVKAQPVPVPPVDEQREIAAVLDAIDRKAELHRRKRTVLDDLFKSLLQKLMTGEIRAKDLVMPAGLGQVVP